MSIQNSIIRVATDKGNRPIALSTSIMAVNETFEMIVQAIIATFCEGGHLLDHWKRVTERMYPGRNDLLEHIPAASKLSLSRLAECGWIMTDTCSPARKFRRLLIEAIVEIAQKEGMDAEQIKIFEADCWQHLRNVWIGAVIKHLGQHLGDVLKDDLVKIHHTLRISTDICDILRAVDKYFAETANYAKVSQYMCRCFISK